jgi:enediyne core biosynthesis thioesterase
MNATFDHEHLVTFEDTNLVGNVYYVNHLRWQGQCRERFLHERAPGVVDALSSGLALVTTRCSCEYFGELFPFDRVLLRMSLGGVRQNRVLMRFDYVRRSEPPELIARGEQEVAVMIRTDRGLRPAPVPAELREALSEYASDTASTARVQA